MTGDGVLLDPLAEAHLVAWLEARPHLEAEDLLAVARNADAAGLPWCGECADWHHGNTPHSIDGRTALVRGAGVELLPLTRAEHTAEIDAGAGRHHRNGHLLELSGCMWRCLHCDHVFDAAVDAERFWCGDDCTGKHPGDTRPIPPVTIGDVL